MKRLIFILSFLTAFALNGLSQSEVVLPDITLNDLHGYGVNVASNHGKPTMLVFWATWCNCTKELDLLNNEYYRWQNSYDLVIYSIPIDDQRSSEQVKPFVEQHGWDFVTLLDNEGLLKAAMKVTNPPYLFLFDKKGSLVYQQLGYSNDFIKNISAKLEEIK